MENKIKFMELSVDRYVRQKALTSWAGSPQKECEYVRAEMLYTNWYSLSE